MIAIRRVYFYLLAAAGLVMLAAGASNLARLLVEVLTAAAPAANTERYVREQVAQWGAMALVGAPVWALHWWWAQRGAAANTDERSSVLRRLYLYGNLAGATLLAAGALHEMLRHALEFLQPATRGRLADALAPIATLLVAGAVWAFHWQAAAADRAVVGEQGGSATLRRWYLYGAAFVGFAVALQGARTLLETLWQTLAAPSAGSVEVLTAGVPAGLVGLWLWLMHWRWAPRAIGWTVVEQDMPSTLRGVYLFLALAVAVAATLGGASQMLYYALGRLFGVERPGGVGGSLLFAAAGPASTALIYGAAWVYQRDAIRLQASALEAPRQTGVRRLYTYLVALLALAALASGLGGLLWALADLATNAPGTASTGWWRERVALFATLTMVGLPVWLAHWRPRGTPAHDEVRSLARRLYAYFALIGGMLALLASAAAAVYLLLRLALGASASLTLTTDLAHSLAVAAVAAVAAGYHWRAIRADARAVQAAPTPSAADQLQPVGPRHAVVRLRAADESALAAALDALRERGLQVEVVG